MTTTADELQYTSITRIAGQDELNAVDVTDMIGKKRLNTEAVDVINSEFINGSITVNTTATEAKVGTSRLNNRRSLFIYNDSINTIYFGGAGVTVSNGVPLKRNSFINLDVGNVAVYLIASFNTPNIKIIEGS